MTRDLEAVDFTAGPSDPSLAARGDTRAFERLYREHVGRIHSLARRWAGPEHADELTQEIFVRAWEKLGTYRGEAAFGTWLYRVAIRWILSWRAAGAAERQRRVGAEALEGAQARPVRIEMTLDFESALERLPDGARRVFLLHDVEGYKHEEIARLLGVTDGTSKAQLHRARMLMRRHLER